jgi:hypothetical protein
MKKLIITCIVSAVVAASIVLLARSVFGRDSNSRPSSEIKRGRDMKSGAKKTWKGARRTAIKVGHKTNYMAKSVARDTKKTAKDIKNNVKD